MDREKLVQLYKNYELTESDVYKHKHYVIITRQGIERIQAKENIKINFEIIKAERDFGVIKAYASKGDATIETYGSALKGKGYADGNCNSWYVTEMAEKRALSRAILKITGFYELGVFGEDESEDFKKSK